MDSTPTESQSGVRWIPAGPARIVIAGSLIAVVVIRLLGGLTDPPWPLHDPALVNILTLVFSFIAVLTAWIWLCFFSGLGKLVQRRLMIGTVLVLAALVAMFRLVEVSGHMVPRFAPRWSTLPDRNLGRVVESATATEIDLAKTTADDFPQFLGPDRSCWVPARDLARNWTTPPKLLWKRPIGAGWSAFAAVNGFAVTLEQRGDEEWVSCYEIATGEPVWGHAIKARHENPLGGIGPRSTPTIQAGKVFTLGATGVLHCLDGATGKVIWKDDLLARYSLTQWESEYAIPWGRAGSPLIVDDLVVVPAGGPTGKAKNLIAYRADSGQVAWESQTTKPEGIAEQISYSSPALGTLVGQRQILIVNEATASSHDPQTGKTLWTHPWLAHSNTDASSSQAVPVGENRVFLSRGYGGGAELIELKPEGDGKFKTTSLWKYPRVLQTKFSNVSIFEGHVYGLSEGILECALLASGKRAWKGGRYGNGQTLGVGGLLLVLAEDGRLALVEAKPDKLNELASFQALEGQTWNNLCLYGKKLLIRNGQEAACYELP